MATGLDKTAALVVVDVQNDFMPGGALAVSGGDEILPPLNRMIAACTRDALTIVATRDWHPEQHCSFKKQGGIWPSHCVASTHGAEFHPALDLTPAVHVVSKAITTARDAYSGFDHTDLAQWLRSRRVQHLLVGGLATDYCVLHTVLDGLAAGFQVSVLTDAVRAVNVQPEDGARALAQMAAAGAVLTDSTQVLD